MLGCKAFHADSGYEISWADALLKLRFRKVHIQTVEAYNGTLEMHKICPEVLQASRKFGNLRDVSLAKRLLLKYKLATRTELELFAILST